MKHKLTLKAPYTILPGGLGGVESNLALAGNSLLRGHGRPAVYCPQDERPAGRLIALNRRTGAIVYQHKLPTSTNSELAIAGNAILVPAGGPNILGPKGLSPQLVVYTVR
jgi:hypothetical protein